MENVTNRLKLAFIMKEDDKESNQQQSQQKFFGIHKSYANYGSSTFKQNDVLMDNPLYLGFAILELSKLLMYEKYYDNLQAHFGKRIYNVVIMISRHLY